MHDGVLSDFVTFTTPLEGKVPWMYVDVRQLVTTGIGNLIDPISLALPLPWVHKDIGEPAAEAAIRTDWDRVKGDLSLAKKGHRACEAITELRLTEEGIASLVRTKLTANEAQLTRVFSDWELWPADAQLGVLSMAWALGAGFPASWPNFTQAARARDWTAAAANCHINEAGNPGVVPRNAANVRLFENAATVEAKGLDVTVLHWPAEVATDQTEPEPTENPSSAVLRLDGVFPDTAAAGAEVTLSGEGFTGADGVLFGDVWADSWSIDSDTQITATVPEPITSGSVWLSVSTPEATSESVSFTYEDEFTPTTPALRLDGVFPDTAAAGAEVTLSGEGFAGANGVLFGGVWADSWSIDSDTQITATVPEPITSGSVWLSVSTPETTSESVSFTYEE